MERLRTQEAEIQGRLANTEQDLALKGALIGELSRGQYKTATGEQIVVMVFGSSSFNDMLGRVIAEITVQHRLADTAHR